MVPGSEVLRVGGALPWRARRPRLGELLLLLLLRVLGDEPALPSGRGTSFTSPQARDGSHPTGVAGTSDGYQGKAVQFDA